MRLSTRSTYGMRALVELALNAGHGPLSATLIAKRQTLSAAYLEQLLHRLKRQGIVTSVRGPHGGYVLARNPHQITMAEIVRILDGNNEVGKGRSAPTKRHVLANGRAHALRYESRIRQDATLRSKSESKAIQHHAQSIAQAVWQCVHERLTQSLDAVTLQDLCDYVRSETAEVLEHRYVFHI